MELHHTKHMAFWPQLAGHCSAHGNYVVNAKFGFFVPKTLLLVERGGTLKGGAQFHGVLGSEELVPIVVPLVHALQVINLLLQLTCVLAILVLLCCVLCACQ